MCPHIDFVWVAKVFATVFVQDKHSVLGDCGTQHGKGKLKEWDSWVNDQIWSPLWKKAALWGGLTDIMPSHFSRLVLTALSSSLALVVRSQH